MKKSFLSIIVLLMMLLPLIACQYEAQESSNQGSGSVPSEAPTGPSQPEPNEGDTEAATRIYTDDLGNTVEIPVSPKRVITTQYTEIMLALDFPPIGAAAHTLEAAYLPNEAEQIENIGPAMEVNFEKILELEPDLIIAHQFSSQFYEQLSEIAPTIILNSENDLMNRIEVIADVLGRQEQAEAWIDNYENLIAEAQSVLSSYFQEGENQVSAKDSVRIFTGNIGYALHTSLGLDRPEEVQKAMEQDPDMPALHISLEVMDQFDADPESVIVRG